LDPNRYQKTKTCSPGLEKKSVHLCRKKNLSLLSGKSRENGEKKSRPWIKKKKISSSPKGTGGKVKVNIKVVNLGKLRKESQGIGRQRAWKGTYINHGRKMIALKKPKVAGCHSKKMGGLKRSTVSVKMMIDKAIRRNKET